MSVHPLGLVEKFAGIIPPKNSIDLMQLVALAMASPLKPTLKLAAIAIIQRASFKDGSCRIGTKRIASDAGISERSVWEALHAFEHDFPLIKVIQGRGKKPGFFVSMPGETSAKSAEVETPKVRKICEPRSQNLRTGKGGGVAKFAGHNKEQGSLTKTAAPGEMKMVFISARTQDGFSNPLWDECKRIYREKTGRVLSPFQYEAGYGQRISLEIVEEAERRNGQGFCGFTTSPADPSPTPPPGR